MKEKLLLFSRFRPTVGLQKTVPLEILTQLSMLYNVVNCQFQVKWTNVSFVFFCGGPKDFT